MRLSEHDASFLYTETASGPMHTAAIFVIEGELSFDKVYEHFQARMHLVPRYQQKLALVPFNLAHPKWVDDPDFDLSDHLVPYSVPAGSTLDLFNHDKTTHNIHTRSKANPIINSAHPSFRKRLRLKNKFKQPETIKAKCDMHAWMSAWFVVTDHPYYAVTDANGAFSLQDVPPGTYTLQVWHETLGQQTQQVTVAANGETPAEVEFSQ